MINPIVSILFDVLLIGSAALVIGLLAAEQVAGRGAVTGCVRPRASARPRARVRGPVLHHYQSRPRATPRARLVRDGG